MPNRSQRHKEEQNRRARPWTPADLSLKPYFMLNYRDWSGSGNLADSGQIGGPWTNNGVLAGGANNGKNVFYLSGGYWSKTFPAIPVGGSISTFAMVYPLNDENRGLWINDLAANWGSSGMLGIYANGTQPGYGCYATASGWGTEVPAFRGDIAHRPGAGMKSQYWQLGPTNGYRRNGTDMFSTVAATNKPGPTPAYPTRQWEVGRVSTAETLHGDLAIICVWLTVPPLSDIQKLEGWTHWDFSLNASLPDDHPYKWAPPRV